MKKFISGLLCASVVMGAMAMPTFAEETGARIYVTSYGNDTNSGATLTSAVKTLERAQEVAAQYAASGVKVDVILEGGTYLLDDTFEVSVSGASETAPIIYRPYGDEEVRLTTAKKITTEFTQCSENLYVTTLDTEAFPTVKGGITDVLWVDGEMKNIASTSAKVELTVNSEETDNVINEETGAEEEVVVATYLNVPEGKDWDGSDDLMVRIDNDWDVSFKSIALSVENSLIKVEGKSGGYSSVHVFNVLGEADSEGEYYIDADNGLLYYYTTGDISNYEMYLSAGASRPIISASGVSNVKFENIDVFCNKQYGYYLNGCNNVTIYGAEVSAMGNYGIYAKGFNNGLIAKCDIGDMARSGVFLSGGEQVTLTDSGSVMRNCNVHDFGRVSVISTGIQLGDKNVNTSIADAVGFEIRNNEIHEGPQMGIHVVGNNNIIDSNRLYNLSKDVWDNGMIYIDRSWTEIGNEITNNFFYWTEDYAGFNFLEFSENLLYSHHTDRCAVYMDDMQSGTTVKGNVVYNFVRGFHVGGGSYNTVEDNLIVESRRGWIIDNMGFRLQHINPNYAYRGYIYYFIKNLIAKDGYDAEKWEAIPAFQYALEYANAIDNAVVYQTDDNGDYLLDENGDKIVDESATITAQNAIVNAAKLATEVHVNNNYFAGDYADHYQNGTGKNSTYLMIAETSEAALEGNNCTINDTDAANSHFVEMTNFTVDKSNGDLYQVSINDGALTDTKLSRTTVDMGIVEDDYVPSSTADDYQVGESNKFKAVAAIYNDAGKLMGTTTYQSTEENDVVYIYDGQQFVFDVDVPEGATTAWYMNLFVWSADGLMRPLATKTPLITPTSAQ